MVRYAEWREAVDPEKPLARYDGLARVGAGLVGAWVGGYCCCFLGAIPGYILAGRAAGDRLTLRRLERLRDSPARFPQHPCHLVLFYEDRAYGWDEGLVSFVDGALLFEGRRTTFSVMREDVRLPAAAKFGFRFATPAGGTCEARLVPVRPKEIAPQYEGWWQHRIGAGEAVVLPPCGPHPTAWRRLRGARTVVAGTFFLGMAATFALYRIEVAAGVFVAIATLIACSMVSIWIKAGEDGLRALETRSV